MTSSVKEISKKFRKTGDAHGLGLDKEIFQIIVFLNALGFYTVSSCEGHLNWGLPYAWVGFSGKTSKRESALEEDNKSTYWRVYNYARNVANQKSDQKFKTKKQRESVVANKFWNKIFEEELVTHKDYAKFKVLEQRMKKESNSVYNLVAVLGKKFLSHYPEYTENFYLEIISNEVRLNFAGENIVNSSKKHTSRQKKQVKEKSAEIVKIFTKYLQDLYHGKIK